MKRRQYKFICAVAGGRFLDLRPKIGPWPSFTNNINAALKFRSEDEAEQWLEKNGNPRVWLEQHSIILNQQNTRDSE